MRGWKAVERQIDPSVPLETAREIMADSGFEEHIKNPEHIIFRRTGTIVTVSAKKIPLEVTLATAESGLYLQARYDAFVLFDTGDLEKVADYIAAQLAP